MAQLTHELVDHAAARMPAALALLHGNERISYAALSAAASCVASALRACGAGIDERVALRLRGGAGFVKALLGASGAGCAAVPIDPALAAERCAAILRDCGAGVLITDAADLDSLYPVLGTCPMLRLVVVQGGAVRADGAQRSIGWESFVSIAGQQATAPAAAALAALLYRVDPGGEVRGMAMSHRNMVAGAQSTAHCASLDPGEHVVVALALHSDYGLNALLATFAAGATAVLDMSDEAGSAGRVEHTLERAVGHGDVGGIFASPATLRQLGGLAQPGRAASGLRFLVCAGGALERRALEGLRAALPRTRIHLLYDIGDACRSTSLMPSMLDQRPGSIGRPLPYSEWRVLRPDGRDCAAGETGELVRCGALVTLGYWNDQGLNTEHFRTLPAMHGLVRRETGYYPGVCARKDADGFLYLADTRADIITQGRRVSPREVEKIVVGTGLVAEAAAVGVDHPVLGQVIAVLATPRPGARLDSAILFGACQARLPRHMLPAMVDVRRAPLPRARDGRIDLARLAGELAPLFAEARP